MDNVVDRYDNFISQLLDFRSSLAYRNSLLENCKKIGIKNFNHLLNCYTPRIILASKYATNQQIFDLYQNRHHRLFAENDLPSLINKTQEFKNHDISWIFIGRLQSKDLSKLLPLVKEIHSLHSFKQYKTIDQIIAKTTPNKSDVFQNKHHKKSIKLFIQVNISHEPQKSGVMPDNLCDLINSIYQYRKNHQVSDLNRIELCGLMAIPSITDNRSKNQDSTNPSMINDQYLDLAKLNYQYGFKQLSLGMSGDWKKALCFNATSLRIGSLIFDPNKQIHRLTETN